MYWHVTLFKIEWTEYDSFLSNQLIGHTDNQVFRR